LTFDGGPNLGPIWGPDDRYVVFGSVGNGTYWTRADGASQPKLLIPGKSVQIPGSFSPDGKWLAYGEGGKIWTLAVEEVGGQLKVMGKPELFSESGISPSFSRDGRWLAYQTPSSPSRGTARAQVFVRPFPPPASGQGGRWLVSTDGGGTRPMFSRTSDKLFYRSGDNQIMSMNYTGKGDVFEASSPIVWIRNVTGSLWDPDPSANRVAVITPVGAPDASQAEPPRPEHTIMFVQNFFDLLRRAVPTER
jgi:serine/threonine-protein kinase